MYNEAVVAYLSYCGAFLDVDRLIELEIELLVFQIQFSSVTVL
jgi:hypothetical protein